MNTDVILLRFLEHLEDLENSNGNSNMSFANSRRISNNVDSISGNLTRINNNVEDISANLTKINNNAENISENTTGISSNAESISNIAESISGNSAGISSITESANTNSDAIGSNSTAISNNTENINANSNAISSNSTGIGNNAESISTNSDAISSNSTGISNNAESINTNSNAISSIINGPTTVLNATNAVNATKAATLATARKINGVSFNGASDIQTIIGGRNITISSSNTIDLDTSLISISSVSNGTNKISIINLPGVGNFDSRFQFEKAYNVVVSLYQSDAVTDQKYIEIINYDGSLYIQNMNDTRSGINSNFHPMILVRKANSILTSSVVFSAETSFVVRDAQHVHKLYLDIATSNLIATTFTGDLVGNASSATDATTAASATNVVTVNDNAQQDRFLIFTDSYSSNTQACKTNANLSYNPGAGLLSALNVTVGDGLSASTLKCSKFVGGYGYPYGNFHIDNNAPTGALVLNYHNEVPIICFNQGTTGNFNVNTNHIDGILYTTDNGSDTSELGFIPLTQWNARLRIHNSKNGRSVFLGDYDDGGIPSQGVYAYKGTMSGWDVLHLNGIQTSSTSFSMNGGIVYSTPISIGSHVGAPVVHSGNDRLLRLGRNQYDAGIEIGGWSASSYYQQSVIQQSPNFHLDCATIGDMYLNFYSYSAAQRSVHIYGIVDASDRRIKKNIVPYDDDELLKQIMNLEITTYNYKDKRFQGENVNKQLGFIADSLENQSYFKYAFKVANYNIPYDESIDMSFTVSADNTIITFNNYTFDLSKEYYLYAYTDNCPDEGAYRVIEGQAMTDNSFHNPYPTRNDGVRIVYSKIELIGEKRKDCKNVSKVKLVAGAYGGIQILNRKIEMLEIENQLQRQHIASLENDLQLIKEHLNL